MAKAEISFLADDHQAVRAAQRLREEIDKAAAAGVDLGVKTTRATNDAKGGFDSLATSALKMGLSVAGVAAQLKFVIDAMKEAEQLRKQAAQDQIASTRSTMPLVQLAKDADDLKRMKDEVRRSRIEFGMDAKAAADLQFTLESSGITQNRRRYAGISGIDDPSKLAEGAQTLVRAMPGTGTDIQMANMMLSASQQSKTRLGQFAPAATLAAQEAGRIGTAPEELLGVLADATMALKSADMAGTGIARVASLIWKKGLGGKGLVKGMEELKKEVEGMNEEEMNTFFGDLRGTRAYLAIMGNKERVQATIERVRAEKNKGPESDYLARMAKMVEEDEEIRSVRRLDIETQKKQIQDEEEKGKRKVRIQVAQTEARRKAAEDRPGGVIGAVDRKMMEKNIEYGETLDQDPEYFEGLGRAGKGFRDSGIWFLPDWMIKPFLTGRHDGKWFDVQDNSGVKRNPSIPDARSRYGVWGKTQPISYHYGDVYQLGQQDVTAPPAPEVIYS